MRTTLLVLLALVVFARGAPASPEALREGVSTIGAPGVPGPLAIFGDDAFAVVLSAYQNDSLRAPIVGATTFGKGRAVAFGHTGYTHLDAFDTGDTERLLLNALKWSAGKAAGDGAFTIGVHRNQELVDHLESLGHDARHLSGDAWFNELEGLDVVCVGTHHLPDASMDPLRDHMRRGGGLVASGLAWGWLQLNPTKTLHDHPGSRLLAPAGIAWANGYARKTHDDGYTVGDEPKGTLELANGSRAIDALEGKGDHAPLDDNGRKQAEVGATLVTTAAPANDRLIRPRLQALLRKHRRDLVPAQDQPFRRADALKRFLLAFQLKELKQTRPSRISAHPSAHAFPGTLPANTRTERVRLTIDTSVPDWHSTGLYALPGKLVRVMIDEELVSTDRKRLLHARIGAHKDELYHKDEWRRAPEITSRFPMDSDTVRCANAFGGPLYIEVPRGCDLGEITVTVVGCIRAPRYVLDKTSLAQWRRQREHPAPWAEMETSKIIVTVPSDVIRELDDPEPAMRFWDTIADAHATLAQIPLERERPERYVTDIQISAGYMHAGYPIMTHLDVAPVMVDVDALRRGNWGLLHELGHNHQNPDWTFAGTGEVTVNLFSLYAIDTVCTPPEGTRGHPTVDRPPSVEKYMKNGARFEDWKRDPFLALQMYIQMEAAFGWDSFKTVFAEYNALPDSERPKSDDEKRDQWMVRYSRTVGRDLGPFFVKWGVPVSDAARQSINDLPDWTGPEE